MENAFRDARPRPSPRVSFSHLARVVRVESFREEVFDEREISVSGGDREGSVSFLESFGGFELGSGWSEARIRLRCLSPMPERLSGSV